MQQLFCSPGNFPPIPATTLSAFDDGFDRLISRWHLERESGLFLGGTDLESPVVRLGDLAGDEQSEAEAVAARPRLAAEEGLEEVRAGVLGDRVSGVGDRQREH